MSASIVDSRIRFVVCAMVLVAGPPHPARAAGEARLDAEVESALATAPRLPMILRLVAARSPDLREAAERASAAEARAGAAGRLPDVELKGELWGVPITRPIGFDRANTIMLGVRQPLPAWGSLEARARAAQDETAISSETAEARRQDLIAQARRAFADYARADREHRIHLEHAGLTSRVIELERALYEAGRGTQQDLLRAQAELSRLHVDIAGIEQHRRSAQAQLNALMDRPLDAPLGPPPEPATTGEADRPDEAIAAAEGQLDERRPELRGAARAVQRSGAAVDVARREATRPALMVGADYWYMPTAPSHHGYGAMVSMSLPWLNPGHAAEVKAAEKTAAAERSALHKQQLDARFQLHDAAAKLQAARETLALIRGRVLADARRSFEAAQAQLQSGRGDVGPVLEAARSYLQVRVEEVRASAELEASRADYDLAAGLPVATMMAPERGEQQR